MAAPSTTRPSDDRLAVSQLLYDINQLSAEGLGSPRHIRRMVDSGRMPASVRLGRLIRFRMETGDPTTGIRDWVNAGCPDCRHVRKTGR